MNGTKYREILDENLLQSVQDLRLGQSFPFQQDNDPKHLHDVALLGEVYDSTEWTLGKPFVTTEKVW